MILRKLVPCGFSLLSMSALAHNQIAFESQQSSTDYSQASLAVAAFAVLISVFSFWVNRRHNRISVKPKLVFRPSTDSKNGKLWIKMYNKGVGPLIFTKFEIRYKGEPYPIFSDLFHAIRRELDLSKDDFDKDFKTFSYGLKDYVLTINETKVLMKFQLSQNIKKEFFKFYDEVKKVEFIYSYEDLYRKEIETSKYELSQHF